MLKSFAIVLLLLFEIQSPSAMPAIPALVAVSGTLVECRAVDSGTLGIEPPMPLFLLRVEVSTCQFQDGFGSEQCVPGRLLEVLARESVATELLQQKVLLEVLAVGDEWGGRNWLQRIEVQP